MKERTVLYYEYKRKTKSCTVSCLLQEATNMTSVALQ